MTHLWKEGRNDCCVCNSRRGREGGASALFYCYTAPGRSEGWVTLSGFQTPSAARNRLFSAKISIAASIKVKKYIYKRCSTALNNPLWSALSHCGETKLRRPMSSWCIDSLPRHIVSRTLSQLTDLLPGVNLDNYDLTSTIRSIQLNEAGLKK